MAQHGPGHLPTVGASRGAITEVPAVYLQVAGPFGAESYAEGSGEKVEDPEIVGPEQDEDRQSLDQHAGGHNPAGAVQLGQYGAAQAADDAHQGDDADDPSG